MSTQINLPFRRPVAPPGLELPPRLSRGLPGIGHSVEFVRATVDMLFRAQRENGEIAAFRVFHREMVALFGPEAHEAVFRAPDAQLSPMEAYKIMTPVFGKGVVYDATPERMGEQLKMLLPALQDRRMRTYGEAVVKETSETVGEWGQTGVVDFVDFCRVLTNFTSSRCLLGKEFREGMSEEFARVYHDLEGGVTPLAYLNAHLPIPAFKKRDKARVRMVEMIGSIVKERRRDAREGEDFLQTLMEARYKDGGSLTDHEITGMLVAAMFAGHHTSSVTTAWTILELLQHPHELEKVNAELDGVFGDGTPVSFQALREISRTEWAVKEALRLHPPLFILLRAVMQDFEVEGYTIKKGAWVVTSPLVAHHESSEFADAMKFDPERYGPGRAEDRKPFTYISFGAGRHKCMGNAFALLQIKTILAIVLRRYELSLVGDPVVGDFQGLVIGPRQPCRVRYTKRK
jgi:sterol 14-demethylase